VEEQFDLELTRGDGNGSSVGIPGTWGTTGMLGTGEDGIKILLPCKTLVLLTVLIFVLAPSLLHSVFDICLTVTKIGTTCRPSFTVCLLLIDCMIELLVYLLFLGHFTT